MLTLTIRVPRATDQAFITNSWVSSLAGPRERWGSRGAVINGQVDSLLGDDRTKLLIACPPDDEDRIIGWCATATVPGCRVIQFVHVRRARRREGIGRLLLGRASMLSHGAPVACLFDTAEGAEFRKRVAPNAISMTPGEFL